MARATRKVAKPAPKPTKDELLAQIEKLERSLARIRTRNKTLTVAASRADARIAELEAARFPAPGKRPRRAATRPTRDPGDAVPPGVGVQTPAPLDAEAETAREQLEQLSGD